MGVIFLAFCFIYGKISRTSGKQSPEEIAKPVTKPNEIAGTVLVKPSLAKPSLTKPGPAKPAANVNVPEEEHYD